MHRNHRGHRFVMPLATSFALLISSVATGQQPAPKETPPGGRGTPGHLQGGMMNQQHMQACGQMMKDMQTRDTELRNNLEEMRAAEGQAKSEAMARVVETLAEQQLAMHDRMREMGPGGCPMMGGE